MANFEVKSRRTIIDQKSGNDKSITEAFFIENCTSWADAEDKMLTYFNSENEVVAMAISKVMDVVNCPTQEEKEERYVYRAVIATIYTDDDGNEKEMKYPVLLWAKDFDNAMTIVNEYIAQGLEDMTLVSLQKTKIVEVI
jgi:hypothetical protein